MKYNGPPTTKDKIKHQVTNILLSILEITDNFFFLQKKKYNQRHWYVRKDTLKEKKSSGPINY